ncbi:tagaturonate reductase [Vibrio mediterranei]
MKTLTRTNFDLPQYTTKIMQFGEGNFLRAFVDWQIDHLNEHTDLDAGIAIIRPIDTDFPPLLNKQDGLYTSVVRGINENDQAVEESRIITSVNQEIAVYQDVDAYMALAKDPNIQFIFSNTTEAGIAFSANDKFDAQPATTFPAKLTQWMFARFKHFGGATDKGLFIIPCELIDYNGDELKAMIFKYIELWELDVEFKAWLEEANTFCSTLVDRIVTGHPREELPELEAKVGYQDKFIVTAEYFYLFVIQGPQELAQALKLDQLDLNIKIVDDIKPYKERKVAILNGAHTALVPVAYLADRDTVGESMNDELLNRYINTLIDNEVIPSLSLAEDELKAFADSVMTRFKNPFIKHQLTSIALNSMTKWKTRLLPQLITYTEKHQQAPKLMSLSLAAQLLYYKGSHNGQTIPLNDEQKWLDFFELAWAKFEAQTLDVTSLVTEVLQDVEHWGQDLNQLPTLTKQVSDFLTQMITTDVRTVVTKTLGNNE